MRQLSRTEAASPPAAFRRGGRRLELELELRVHEGDAHGAKHEEQLRVVVEVDAKAALEDADLSPDAEADVEGEDEADEANDGDGGDGHLLHHRALI